MIKLVCTAMCTVNCMYEMTSLNWNFKPGMLTALPRRLELLDKVFLKIVIDRKKLIPRTQAQYIHIKC